MNFTVIALRLHFLSPSLTSRKFFPAHLMLFHLPKPQCPTYKMLNNTINSKQALATI